MSRETATESMVAAIVYVIIWGAGIALSVFLGSVAHGFLHKLRWFLVVPALVCVAAGCLPPPSGAYDPQPPYDYTGRPLRPVVLPVSTVTLADGSTMVSVEGQAVVWVADGAWVR